MLGFGEDGMPVVNVPAVPVHRDLEEDLLGSTDDEMPPLLPPLTASSDDEPFPPRSFRPRPVKRRLRPIAMTSFPTPGHGGFGRQQHG